VTVIDRGERAKASPACSRCLSTSPLRHPVVVRRRRHARPPISPASQIVQNGRSSAHTFAGSPMGHLLDLPRDNAPAFFRRGPMTTVQNSGVVRGSSLPAGAGSIPWTVRHSMDALAFLHRSRGEQPKPPRGRRRERQRRRRDMAALVDLHDHPRDLPFGLPPVPRTVRSTYRRAPVASRPTKTLTRQLSFPRCWMCPRIGCLLRTRRPVGIANGLPSGGRSLEAVSPQTCDLRLQRARRDSNPQPSDP
jgi:hypothetical protein